MRQVLIHLFLFFTLLTGSGIPGAWAQAPEVKLFQEDLIRERRVKSIRQYSVAGNRELLNGKKIMVSRNLEKIWKFDTLGRLMEFVEMKDSTAIHTTAYHFDYKNEPDGSIYSYSFISASGDTTPFILSDRFDYYSKYEEPDSSLWFSIGENDRRTPEHKILRTFRNGKLHREHYFEYHDSREAWKEVRYRYPNASTVVKVTETRLSGYRDSVVFHLNEQGRLVRKHDFAFIQKTPSVIYTDYLYDSTGTYTGFQARSSDRALLYRTLDFPWAEHFYNEQGLPSHSFLSTAGESGKVLKYQYKFYPMPAPEENTDPEEEPKKPGE